MKVLIKKGNVGEFLPDQFIFSVSKEGAKPEYNPDAKVSVRLQQ